MFEVLPWSEASLAGQRQNLRFGELGELGSWGPVRRL